nr:cytochrome c biogenesis protein CcdA [uncultured Pseudodesulfovibrio sp.]
MKITKQIFTLFYALLLSLSWTVAHAQISPGNIPMVTPVKAYWLAPDSLLLTLSLDMEPDWYTYADVPGGMGKPTRLSGTTASGATIKPLYPDPIVKPDAFDPSSMVNTYKSGTKLFAIVPIDKPIFPIKLQLDLLLCHPTKCVPARLDLTFGDTSLDIATLPLADKQPWWNTFNLLTQKTTAQPAEAVVDSNQPTIVEWQFTPTYLQPGLEVASLLSAVLMGLLAGLILNIMPCVLPVVSLKLSALLGANTSTDGKDPIAAFREHNLFFVLGVLSFFLFLAIVLGATGQAWGALFQYRWLVLVIAAIMGALGLSLFGLFHLPVIDLKFGAGHANPRKQAFFTGMLTTLLATPCSGPFLGGVLGWALIQGPLVITIVFISIGIGMSSPYLLLILNPKFARFLPKSGPWIEYVEKGIAFFLLGTAFYLVAIAIGSDSLRILAPLWSILLGSWLWVRTQSVKATTRWGVRVGTLILLASSVIWTMPSSVESDPWIPFDPVAVQQNMGKEILLLDFTADWCPTCKVLEATVMTHKNVSRWKKEYSIKFIKVDMTKRDPEAEALLKALGSRSIPTAAIFTKNDPSSPIVLRDLFTEDQLENIMKSL